VKTGCIRTENRERQFRYRIIGGILGVTINLFAAGLLVDKREHIINAGRSRGCGCR